MGQFQMKAGRTEHPDCTHLFPMSDSGDNQGTSTRTCFSRLWNRVKQGYCGICCEETKAQGRRKAEIEEDEEKLKSTENAIKRENILTEWCCLT